MLKAHQGSKFIKTIYFDCETTGINPYYAEILTAFFAVYENGKIIDSYDFKSKVLKWSDEAQLIHKITIDEMNNFPEKKKAFRDLLKWLPKDFQFITYANKNTELGVINFDVALLENELSLLGCPNHYLKNKHFMSEAISLHPFARKMGSDGYFSPVRKQGKKGFRPSYSQENVYFALFGEKYNSHNAKDDVLALVRIHNKLLELKNENRDLLDWC